jgi:viologen exporter family transport system permease protein
MNTRHISKYLEIAKINSVVTLHHSVNLLGRGLILLVRLWIFTQLYRATFDMQHTTEINGLTLAMVIWNLVFVQSFNVASRPAVSRIIDEEVKTGTLAYSISRPYIYNLFHYFGFVGRVVPSVITNVVLGSLVGVLMVGPIPITPQAILAGGLLLMLGFSLDFLMSLSIGLAAFWLEDTSALMWLFHKGFMVFGGAILPLALFPDKVRIIAESLPFAQLYYGAARILVHYDPALFARFLQLQLGWIAVFGTLVTIMYRRGVRYVSLNGG